MECAWSSPLEEMHFLTSLLRHLQTGDIHYNCGLCVHSWKMRLVSVLHPVADVRVQALY